MVSILQKRFKEIGDRKRLKIKAYWFKPLNQEQLEKLGIKGGKEEKFAI